YGLDRFSEDLDFSLRAPMRGFELDKYSPALEKELRAFGFDVRDEDRCTIRTGHGPENITRLRRFAIDLKRRLPMRA
ncbi:hypothetical protein MNBD_GAMMA13-2126, partial [hydrothermal vent metagenome]